MMTMRGRGRLAGLMAGVSLGALAMAAPAVAQQAVRVGQTVDGALSAGDEQLNSGEFVDTYSFRGQAGQRVSVRMSSDAFDAYVMMRGPSDFTHDNDDAGDGGTDSLLDLRLPVSGDYQIMATSFQAGERGAYRLQVGGPGGAGPTPPSVAPNGGGNSVGPGELAPGRTVRGELRRGDDALTSGEFVDSYIVQARRGQTFEARLSSTAFDPYLLVRGPGGLNEDNDDDPSGRGSRDSLIRFTAQADGPITVAATSYQPNESGAYTLALSGDGGGTPPPRNDGAGQSEGVLRLGQTVRGALSAGDQRMRSGEYLNSWRFDGRRGQTVDLRLSSGAFDPYLMITGPGDFSDFNDDDANGGTDSRLVVTLPADGPYEVTATSYTAGETGAYTLSAQASNASAPDQPALPDRPSDAAGTGIGRVERGALQRGDETLNSGEFVDHFTFQGRRGQRVAISARSSDFDTYLLLNTPGGEQIDNDDGGEGQNTNSLIEMALPEDGQYAVGVTSYQPGETGGYELAIQPSQGSERQQAVQGGQRVFAVMVGVSEYGDVANDLPYTAEDAIKLNETLAREGVLNPASVVLTDAQATVAGVRRAFERVAAQAGPDDVFLFFYSGHGDQEELDGPTATELDGQRETLVLRDGVITDVELGEMFGTLRSRLSLLVLDSCFSGGFAKNVVNRPGVMGLFSSEEDLTSAVAEKFEAGGYLSHFLRAAVSGDGDADGDGMLTAGELSAYLRIQFAREVYDVEAETSDGQRNYQNLVVDRGGVQVDDVILRLGTQTRSLGRP